MAVVLLTAEDDMIVQSCRNARIEIVRESGRGTKMKRHQCLGMEILEGRGASSLFHDSDVVSQAEGLSHYLKDFVGTPLITRLPLDVGTPLPLCASAASILVRSCLRSRLTGQ